MKVYDVLTETKKTDQVDEGPIRFIKAKMGNKSAQLDIEIDKEVKSIYKDFVAVTKQDPKIKGMTVDSLSNFLAAKGFANSPKEVKAYIKQDMSIMKKIGKGIASGTKATIKGAKAGIDAAKTGASAVVGAAKKLAKEPPKSGLAPDPRQGELDLNSMYTESLLLEAELSGSEVKKVIKRFVQQGFQKQMGSRLGKSAYGDAPADTTVDTKKTSKAKDTSKADAKDMATPTMDIESAKKFLQANGYTVTLKKKAKRDPADVNNDGKVSDDERSSANYKSNFNKIFRKNK